MSARPNGRPSAADSNRGWSRGCNRGAGAASSLLPPPRPPRLRERRRGREALSLRLVKPEEKRALPPGAAGDLGPLRDPGPPCSVLVSRSVMTKDMASSSLEDLCFHINAKISNIKKCIQLRDIGESESHKPMLCKIQNEITLAHDLLNKMEIEVKQQAKLKDLLKEIQKAAERHQSEAQHLLEHIPPYLPKSTQTCIRVPTVKHDIQTKAAEPKCAKKPAIKKKVIKEAALITVEEFKSVPAYMKGRLTYDQINAVVGQINKAVVEKYKILYRPLKSMSAPVRNLYHRFIKEEIKDTKGAFFIVEADIKEFTEMKLDKRFHNILSILRHCQRVREVRSSGLVRFVIC